MAENIFSEIYGTYYRIAAKALSADFLTDRQIYALINEDGFGETSLSLSGKLLPGKDSWGLLERLSDGRLAPVTRHKPKSLLTNLQKKWLCAKLADPRIRLFISDDVLENLREELSGIEPLCRPQHFRYIDRFSDGDNFSDENYRANFRTCLAAVKSHEIVFLDYTSGHGKAIKGCFVLVKLEYSPKNDKFRAYCLNTKNRSKGGKGLINIGRINKIIPTGKFYEAPISLDELFAARRCDEPVVVRVTDERNSVERFMMEFSAYEKRSEFSHDTGCCTVRLWYDKYDETELLIRLLSFGPTIEILSPENFRAKAAARVRQQYELLKQDTH